MNTILRQPTKSTANRILSILLDFGLPVAALTGQADFARDLGMDSLDRTDLLLRVETDFGIHIDDRDWHELRTMDTLTAYIEIEEGIATPTAKSPAWLPQVTASSKYPLFTN